MENSIIKNVTLNNVTIQAKTAGQVHYSSNWILENVKIETDDDSKVLLENTSEIDFPKSVYE